MNCKCNCGYRCGGPGKCELEPFVRLNQKDGKHFVIDCGHVWNGPCKTSGDGLTRSVTCSVCGVWRIHHDAMVGP